MKFISIKIIAGIVICIMMLASCSQKTGCHRKNPYGNKGMRSF